MQRVALAYEIDSSRARLVDATANAVDVGKEPSPMLRPLTRLESPIVVTTNYDGLFEPGSSPACRVGPSAVCPVSQIGRSAAGTVASASTIAAAMAA